MVAAFLVPRPGEPQSQRPREMWAALHEGDVATGLWVIMLAGMAFGVLDGADAARAELLGAQ